MPSPVPDAEPGLVISYGYVWLDEAKRGRITPTKERPACIVMQATAEQAKQSRSLKEGDVVILPISTKPPRHDQTYVKLSQDERRLCGLYGPHDSWVITSEYNIDTWPNADIAKVPATGTFAYGKTPYPLLRRIARSMQEARDLKRSFGLRRNI